MAGALINERYQIEAELGSGGMGVVYRAHDRILERTVAIKTLPRAGLDDESRGRLQREAQAVARLNHPHIVSVYDAGEFEGAPYIVMELVNGQSLRSLDSPTLTQILTIARQMGEALAYAHAQGIIHRDLKPENILVVQAGERLTAKLNDFGLALSTHNERLTQAGAFIGTALYMAPELIQGQTASPQSDLYALGAVLYECLAGRPAFSGENLIAVLSQHLNAPVVPPSTFNPEIPAALERLILQMLEKKPEDRPPSAEWVLAALGGLSAADEMIGTQPAVTSLERIVRGRLVGREREFEQARSTWQQAAAGASRVLLISGEPGIGKTRFANELMAQAQFQRATVLLGECFAEGGPPYAAVAQMIEAAPVPAEIPPYALAALLTLAPGLQARYPEIPANTPLQPEAELQRLSDSLVEWCRGLCQAAPLLIVLDDAHWADSGSLALLRNLARRAARLRLRLLLVFTYREVELDEGRALNEVLYALNREHLATRLKLGRLDIQQTEEMLATLFAEAITPELLQALYRETEGNPFFIEEVCKALIEAGQVYRDGKGWSRLAIEEIEIPQNVRVAIQARLARLEAATQETLRLAAVIGREFEFDLLSAVAGQQEEALIAALEQAERAQLVLEKPPTAPSQALPGLVFRFTHALIHATLFESLSGLRRQRLHRQVAAALAALHPESYETLAYHYALAGLPDPARACYLKAGERALSTFANQEAEKYFRLALDLGGSAAEQAQGLYGLGWALYQESRPAEAARQWQLAVPLYQQFGDYDHLAKTYAQLTNALRLQDDIEGSWLTGEEGLKALAEAPASAGNSALLRETGISYSFSGATERAIALFREALQIAEQVGSLEEQSLALIRLGFELVYAPTNALPAEGAQMIQDAADLAETGGYFKAAELAHAYLSQIERDFANDLKAALEHANRAVQFARQIGMAASELFDLGIICSIHSYFGNLAELEALVERSTYLLQLIETTGSEIYVFRTAQAAVAYLHGDMAGTEEILQAAFDEACRNKNSFYANFIAFFLSMLFVDHGEWEKAEALQAACRFGDQPLGVSDYSYLAIIYSHTQRLEAAQQTLEKAQALIGDRSSAVERTIIAQAEAEVAAASQDWEKAWVIFEGVTEQLARAGIRFYEARLLQRWIAARLWRGQAEDRLAARALLERLSRLYAAMGAVELAADAHRQAAQIT